jgi:hypothetical protein
MMAECMRLFRSSHAQAYIQQLVGRLQLHSVELGGVLEELSAAALSAVPRVLRDAERVRKDSAALKERMGAFGQHLSNVHRAPLRARPPAAGAGRRKLSKNKVEEKRWSILS